MRRLVIMLAMSAIIGGCRLLGADDLKEGEVYRYHGYYISGDVYSQQIKQFRSCAFTDGLRVRLEKLSLNADTTLGALKVIAWGDQGPPEGDYNLSAACKPGDMVLVRHSYLWDGGAFKTQEQFEESLRKEAAALAAFHEQQRKEMERREKEAAKANEEWERGVQARQAEAARREAEYKLEEVRRKAEHEKMRIKAEARAKSLADELATIVK